MDSHGGLNGRSGKQQPSLSEQASVLMEIRDGGRLQSNHECTRSQTPQIVFRLLFLAATQQGTSDEQQNDEQGPSHVAMPPDTTTTMMMDLHCSPFSNC